MKHAARIIAMIDRIVQRAATRMRTTPHGMLPAETYWLTASELSRLNRLQLALPSAGEVRPAAAGRVQLRRAERLAVENGRVGAVIRLVVCRHFGVEWGTLLQPNRSRTMVTARSVAAWLFRRELGCSYPEIGRMLQRDHSCVMRACRAIDAALLRDAPLARVYRAVLSEVERELEDPK